MGKSPDKFFKKSDQCLGGEIKKLLVDGCKGRLMDAWMSDSPTMGRAYQTSQTHCMIKFIVCLLVDIGPKFHTVSSHP